MPESRKTRKILVNLTNAGVVYDQDGHSLGGDEQITVEGLDGVAEAAISAGQLALLTRSD